MKRMKQELFTGFLSLSLALGAPSCASYPQIEMDQAKQAVAQARAAQAEKFAPAEYAEAQGSLVEAEQQAAAEEYKLARLAAVAAKDAGARALGVADKNRKIFEENERRRIEEEKRLAEEEAKRKAEEEALLAQSNLFEEELSADDAFASEFGDEFERAAGGQGEEEFTEQQKAVSFVAPEPEPPMGESRPYFVQRYDTLAGIAARADVYGDASLWYLIWDANRDLIKDPDLLPRGEIRIPVRPTPEQKDRARGSARERAAADGWSLWDGR